MMLQQGRLYKTYSEEEVSISICDSAQVQRTSGAEAVYNCGAALWGGIGERHFSFFVPKFRLQYNRPFR